MSQCSLNDDRFKTIITKKHLQRHISVLCLTKQLDVTNIKLKNGWTELFNGLCSSCITTLDVRGNSLDGEECCTALKCLLINNKTLTVLKIGHQYNHNVFCCIADALSQNCSLKELTIINSYRLSIQGWTKLFESLHKNTTLNTLDCSNDYYYLKFNNKVAKSVCEMLIHNQDLQNLSIGDELFIEGHLKEFAMAYIQRKPVLNLTVRR